MPARRFVIALLASGLLLAGCGSEDEPDSAQEALDQAVDALDGQIDDAGAAEADMYAFSVAGRRDGCALADISEAERKKGCIYAAAHTGCLVGLEQREPLPDPSAAYGERDELAAYEKAVEECVPDDG